MVVGLIGLIGLIGLMGLMGLMGLTGKGGNAPGIGPDFTDVTLASEGETKNVAHKIVLISAIHKQIQQKIEQLILRNKHITKERKVNKTFILKIESLVTK